MDAPFERKCFDQVTLAAGEGVFQVRPILTPGTQLIFQTALLVPMIATLAGP
jgi:hypothetical protein